MDVVSYLLVLCSILFSCLHFLKQRTKIRLPPGPRPLPLIGNIHQLSPNLHHSLAKLAKNYGPLMHLKLGFVSTVVVSSPELAREFLQKHDRVLSARHQSASMDAYGHNNLSMIWMGSSPKWKAYRKLCKQHMFSLQKLDANRDLHRAMLEKLRQYVQECCDSQRVVDIADATFTTVLNLISSSLLSMDLATYNSDSSHEFMEIVRGLVRILAVPNLADYFPFLRHADPQGNRRISAQYMGKAFKHFNEIIEQRLESHDSECNKNDLLHALLDSSDRNEQEFTRDDMLHLLMDLILGSDSTGPTIEWAMAELIQNPKMMMRARNELNTIIGERSVEESDLSSLPYLQAVLKETFRLHPVAPLMVPRKAETNIEINGYIVPKNVQIQVNIWAIGRDPSIWANPESFEPERFLNSKIDVKGKDFMLIPFGSGRRICPGMTLALRIIPLVLAALIKDFDWKLDEGMRPEEMNMDEKFGFTLQKAVPIKAIPFKHNVDPDGVSK